MVQQGAGPGTFRSRRKVDGRWQFFDPDLGLTRRKVPLASIITGEGLTEFYRYHPEVLPRMLSAAAQGNIRVAHVSQFPAPRGAAFQKVAEWLTAFAWLVLGGIWITLGLSSVNMNWLMSSAKVPMHPPFHGMCERPIGALPVSN